MDGVILSIGIASFIAVMLSEVVKNIVPTTVNTAGKTIIALVLELISGLSVGLINSLVLTTPKHPVVSTIIVVVLTICVSQLAYSWICKPVDKLVGILSEKLKAIKKSH